MVLMTHWSVIAKPTNIGIGCLGSKLMDLINIVQVS